MELDQAGICTCLGAGLERPRAGLDGEVGLPINSPQAGQRDLSPKVERALLQGFTPRFLLLCSINLKLE